MRWKREVHFSIVLILSVSVFVAGFYYTGGRGLVNLYFNYLSQDIPNKKYSWTNFTDRGEGELISGYYAGSVGSNVWVWTLSGLKRYVHNPGLSVYYYIDTCGLIRQLSEGSVESETLDPNPLFTHDEWKIKARRGDFVSITWVHGESGKRLIDKMHASSNQYYPIEKIRLEQCQK